MVVFEVFDSSREGQMVLGRKSSVHSVNQLEFRTREPCALDLRIDGKSGLLYGKGQHCVGGLSADGLETDCNLCGNL